MSLKRLFYIVLAIGTVLSLLFALGGSSVQAQDKPRSHTDISTNVVYTAELIGQIGGESAAIAWKDDLLYYGVGPRLFISDVTDISQPVVIGFTEVMPWIVQDVALVGDLAYVADGRGGLRIVDVSDPSAPVEIGAYEGLALSYAVAVAGSYAYVADAGYGLRVIDISNPAAPHEVGYYITVESADGACVPAVDFPLVKE